MTTIDAHPLGRAALVLAAALLVFAAALLAGDGSEEFPADTTSTPDLPTATASPKVTSTPAATPTATPEPTATPRPGPEPAFGELPPSLEVAEAGTWVRQTLAPGEEPAPNHGVLIRDLETGGGEHWSLADGPELGTEFFAYGVAGDGRFASFGSPFEPSLLVDRETEAAFAWDTSQFRFIVATADGRLVLGTTRSEDEQCLYWVVDLGSGAPEPVLRFGLPGARDCSGASAAFEPSGAPAMVLSTNDPTVGRASIYRVDLDGGEVEAISAVDSYRQVTSRSGVAHWINTFGDPAENESVGVIYDRYDWADGELSSTRFEATANGERTGLALPSPDGALIAWQEALRLGHDLGLGGYFEWPVVVVANRQSGEPLLRVVRATITSAIESTDWLADSSGLVISVEGSFALLEVGPDAAASITPLPFPHMAHFAPLPVPSPRDPLLFAYNQRFVDRAGNDVLPPLVVAWARQGPLRGDWTSGGAEYHLATWAQGAGDFGAGPLAPFGLVPRVQTPPFSNDVRLATTEPVDLREAFDRESEASWHLEVGTVVVVQNDESLRCAYDFGCATRLDPNFEQPRPWWFFVRTEDGRAGWAPHTALAWAE